MLISYKNLKGAVDQPQQKICLVPELCRLTGLTQNQRDDHRIMRYVADKTNDVPTDRERKRLDLIRRIKNCDDAYQVRRRISIFPLINPLSAVNTCLQWNKLPHCVGVVGLGNNVTRPHRADRGSSSGTANLYFRWEHSKKTDDGFPTECQRSWDVSTCSDDQLGGHS